MSTLPMPLRIVLGLLTLGAIGLIVVLAKFWGSNPEYADRFLILLGSGWVAWQRRGELAALPLRPSLTGWPLLILGGAAFPVGWYLQAQVAPKPVVIWWLALAWIAAAAGLVLLLAGYRHLRILAFPLVFILFACPIPNRVLVPLQARLQGITTSIAAATLPVFGFPVERDGFTLKLPHGTLGVVEACSGVRSVTTLSALAAFVACLKGFGPLRGLSLLGLAIPVIAAVNGFRVILSGLIQEWFGGEYIQGDWHLVLGMVMVLLGLVFVVLIADRLEPKPPAPDPEPSSDATPSPPAPYDFKAIPRRAVLASAIVLALAMVGTATAQFLGRSTESTIVATAPLEQIPAKLGHWKAMPRAKKNPGDPDTVDQEISHYIEELLTYDKAIFRRYYNEFGLGVDVWVIFWSSQSMVKGYHHPDVCLTNRGFAVKERERKSLAVADGVEVPVTIREFVLPTNKTQRLLVLYWTQEGKHIWTEEDELSAQTTGDSHNWLRDRLLGVEQARETGRIVVLISSPLHGDGVNIRKETFDFTRQLADAVYQLCPWAKPGR